MPPKKKAQATKSLEATLWDAADELRGKMDSAQYKHVVLGLIFLKYVSDTSMVRHDELARLVDDPSSEYFMPNEAAKHSVLEDRDEYTAEGIFWNPASHRWDDLKKAAKQPDTGKRVDEAIERENPALKGVLPKNYTQRELSSESIGGLIDTFSRQDLAAEEFKDLDVLGRVYEYFLGNFASNEGKKAGEYYTPRSVVQLLVEMLQPYHGRVFDPACGSGGMFVQADKFVRAHRGNHNDIPVYGQESNPTTWRLAKMNLALRGIEANLGPEWGDTFHADAHPDLKADFVIAHPPSTTASRAANESATDQRWKCGVPPAQNANYAWLQHFLHHVSPTGTVGTVLANGSLSSQQNGEGEIRKALVEADLIECIVAPPPQPVLRHPDPGVPLVSDEEQGRHRQRHEDPTEGTADISVIDDEFRKKFEMSDQKNLQLEAVRRLISNEVKIIGQRNVVARRKFSERLSEALNRYQNRTIDAAQVIAEIVEIAKAIKAQRQREEQTGLTENELAFYDALATNESARLAMEDETLRAIAHELTEIVRNDARTDWQVKETVRAKLRTRIKRLLLQHGYPPDQEPTATDLIIKQAEVMAEVGE